ncbi:hypothetical protein GOARA_040_00060 [Gordonia araii NBRC 100433]|uniref:DUF3806 domain-containing protein n=1 Tax=Gordonia araii NBRC 100433 TaxID=1073574 RepID=G7H0V6_9ACTN|nr:hypothetical protein [Gordonia araii]NNG97704.1 hypothetical protein [Gordonia araii NBRC 100433]GAB09481.1 hypothetical protein GOARA_040_00060 [Gordonia araii NBRC 100433]
MDEQNEDTEPPLGTPWTGRPLRLQYPPAPEHGADHAALFVTKVRDIEDVQLDYSDASLNWIDGWLGDWSEPGSDRVAESVFAAGCYFGEVLVRNHGYRWTIDENVHGGLMAVTGPRGNVANPIGKAFKRVDNGETDSLSYLLTVLLAD